ncbi:MAG: YyaL domain-containing protein [Thermoanaerobaculia bacterium]
MTLYSTSRARLGTLVAATLVVLASALQASADEAPAASWERWNDRTLSVPRDRTPLLILVSSRICNPCRQIERSLLASGFHRVVVDEADYPRVAAAYRAFAAATDVPSAVPLAVVATPAFEPLVAVDGSEPAGVETRVAGIRERWNADSGSLLAQAAIAVRRFKLNSAAVVHRESLSERAAQIHDDLLSGDETRRSAAVASLKTIAASALFDQLGGGFFHHAADPEMRVPHFERSLEDQAVMLELYIDAYAKTREQWFADVARMTATALVRDFATKSGAFYNGLESKSLVPRGGSPHIVEGGAYVWDAAEIRHLLGEADAKLFFHVYGLRDEGNIPAAFDRSGDLRGKSIPFVSGAPASEESAQRLAAARKKLLDVRLKRPPAALDDRVIAGPNARAVSALARAALVLQEPEFGRSAERALRALLDSHVDGRQLMLYRTRGRDSIAAASDDYALVVRALLDAYAIAFEPLFLQRAIELQSRHDARFLEGETNRYDVERGVPSAVAGLAVNPELASTVAANLSRVSDFTNDATMYAMAKSTGSGISARRRQTVIRGALGADATQALLKPLEPHRGVSPIIVLRNERERRQLASLLPYLATFADCPFPREGRSPCPEYGAVCFDGSCGPATLEPERLRAAVEMRIDTPSIPQTQVQESFR